MGEYQRRVFEGHHKAGVMMANSGTIIQLPDPKNGSWDVVYCRCPSCKFYRARLQDNLTQDERLVLGI